MVKLIVEGGSPSLEVEVRKAFHNILSKSGLKKLPRVIVAGGRARAYDRYKTALEHRETAILLIDSENAIGNQFRNTPWRFLQGFENWDWLPTLNDNHCHLMVQCMESWFLADKEIFRRYFGSNFAINSLPQGSIESISKTAVIQSINRAANRCKPKNSYEKGRDSFKMLMMVSPDKLRSSSFWADRFFKELERIMDCDV